MCSACSGDYENPWPYGDESQEQARERRKDWPVCRKCDGLGFKRVSVWLALVSGKREGDMLRCDLCGGLGLVAPDAEA